MAATAGRCVFRRPAVRRRGDNTSRRQCLDGMCFGRASRRFFQSRRLQVESVLLRAALLALAGLVCALACGCAGTKDKASADKLTQDVGKYSPPPSISDAEKPKVGFPSFVIQSVLGQFTDNKTELAQNAADQMTTLMVETGRF